MLLKIDNSDDRPIYLQIINQVKEQISRGILKPGEALPSVREVADSLDINLHTVRSAYLKLRDQGIINLHLGRRATVAKRQIEVRNLDSEEALKIRLKEMITDALLIGLSPDDIRKLTDQQLEHLKKEQL